MLWSKIILSLDEMKNYFACIAPVNLLFQLFLDLHLFRPMMLTLSPSTFTTTANHLAGLGPCPCQLKGISSFITHSYECQGVSVVLRCCLYVVALYENHGFLNAHTPEFKPWLHSSLAICLWGNYLAHWDLSLYILQMK